MTKKERSFILGRILAQMDFKEKRGEKNVDDRVQETISTSFRSGSKRKTAVVEGSDK